MKVGDLVKPSDPYERMMGIIVAVDHGRIGQDLLAREVQVCWLYSMYAYHRDYTWATRTGLEVISESR